MNLNQALSDIEAFQDKLDAMKTEAKASDLRRVIHKIEDLSRAADDLTGELEKTDRQEKQVLRENPEHHRGHVAGQAPWEMDPRD